MSLTQLPPRPKSVGLARGQALPGAQNHLQANPAVSRVIDAISDLQTALEAPRPTPINTVLGLTTRPFTWR